MGKEVNDEDFFAHALDRATAEFALLTDTWKNIDTKAQATATIGGIFVAATFAIAKDAKFSGFEKIILFSAILFLIAGIVASIRAALVTRAAEPYTGSTIAKIVFAALDAATDDRTAHYTALLADTVRGSCIANDKLRAALTLKSDRLLLAQKFMMGAVIAFVALAFMAIFSSPVGVKNA